jgi:hypothetical protein
MVDIDRQRITAVNRMEAQGNVFDGMEWQPVEGATVPSQQQRMLCMRGL